MYGLFSVQIPCPMWGLRDWDSRDIDAVHVWSVGVSDFSCFLKVYGAVRYQKAWSCFLEFHAFRHQKNWWKLEMKYHYWKFSVRWGIFSTVNYADIELPEMFLSEKFSFLFKVPGQFHNVSVLPLCFISGPRNWSIFDQNSLSTLCSMMPREKDDSVRST